MHSSEFGTSTESQKSITHHIHWSEPHRLNKCMNSQTNIHINLCSQRRKCCDLFISYSSHSDISSSWWGADKSSTSVFQREEHLYSQQCEVIILPQPYKLTRAWRCEIGGSNHVVRALRVLCIKTPILHSNA